MIDIYKHPLQEDKNDVTESFSYKDRRYAKTREGYYFSLSDVGNKWVPISETIYNQMKTLSNNTCKLQDALGYNSVVLKGKSVNVTSVIGKQEQDIANHIVTRHNFCKDIPDEVMDKPLLGRLKARLKDLEDLDIINSVTKSVNPELLKGRKMEIQALINELTNSTNEQTT